MIIYPNMGYSFWWPRLWDIYPIPFKSPFRKKEKIFVQPMERRDQGKERSPVEIKVKYKFAFS